MNAPNRRLPLRIGPRLAFTLVELMVVIAIIGILTALAAVGVFAMIGSRYRSNTETTISILDRKFLQDCWNAVVADAKKETPSQAVMALAGNDPERAKVIWIKVRLAEAFPVAFKEINPADKTTIVNTYIDPSQLKRHFVTYRQSLEKIGYSYPTQTAPAKSESSACLLMALRTLTTSGVSVEEHLKHAIKDKDEDGLPEFVDSWDNPLAFFRFPWNNKDLQDSNPGSAAKKGKKFADPVDPGGTLMNNAWYASPGKTAYEAVFHPIRWTEADGTKVNACYVTPVIVSFAKSPVPNLNADFSPLPNTNVSENIYSFKLR